MMIFFEKNGLQCTFVLKKNVTLSVLNFERVENVMNVDREIVFFREKKWINTIKSGYYGIQES